MDATLDRDGYQIHLTVLGAGPRIVWVDPALGSSAMRPLQDAVDLLAGRFEMVTYDRRGRGRNAPTEDLSVEHEVADLQALLRHLGGASAVLGFSSGGALVLRAAALLATRAVVLLEPAVDAEPDATGLRGRIADALAAGHDEDAVLAFYEATGVPEEIVEDLRASRAWPHVVRSAPTLLPEIDLAVVDDDTVAALAVPVHVILSTGSPREITEMGARLCARLADRAGARLWHEPGGWHGVEPLALAARLADLIGC